MTQRYHWSNGEYEYELEFSDPYPEDGNEEDEEEEDEDYQDADDNNPEENSDESEDEEEEEEEEDDEEDDDEEDDDDTETMTLHDLITAVFGSIFGLPMSGQAAPRPRSPTPEPDYKTGEKLVKSGEFGPVMSPFSYVRYRSHSKSNNITSKLWMRQLTNRPVHQLHMGEEYLPSNPGKVVDVYNCAVYSAQFSDDGSILAASDRDFNLHIYKAHGDEIVKQKTIRGAEGTWTITDHALSPDNEWLIYSSINPYVHLTRTGADESTEQYPLDFSVDGDNVPIWSLRFSGNGREIVAGGSTQIIMYDIESRTVLTSVHAHTADVNAVCFAEPQSSHVIFSGSDDRLVKVWDRRSMRNSGRSPPSGVLVGHAAGLTYVTSKGDNRYLASNGKDQKMLLWDLRKMYSNEEYRQLPKETYRADIARFDYRSGRFPGSKSLKLKNDCSVMTFQGHSVLRTLIRCHFSPLHSTGGRYLYTGSADGVVTIYRMDGKIVRRLDTGDALKYYTRWANTRGPVARDVSWHPHYPTIVSTCWASRGYYGYDSTGVLVKHSFRHASDIEEDEKEIDGSEPELPRTRRRRLF
ncbi:hypothetical protein BGW42_007965 [Actinomortierella wolfii]|nr:hypothetical protein BGW42_007965 [Actinomortierella wolfii]